MKWLLTAVIAATACGGTTAREGGDENGSNALSSVCSGAEGPNGEDGGLSQQSYQAGDPIISVEALPLPVTNVAPSGDDVIAGQFLFRNYGVTGNAATRVCIRAVGPDAAKSIESLRFDVIPGTLESASFTGQSLAGVICNDRPFAVGAGGNIALVIVIKLVSGAVPGAVTQFEIASPADVTLSDLSEEIGGTFPVRGEPLTVVPRC